MRSLALLVICIDEGELCILPLIRRFTLLRSHRANIENRSCGKDSEPGLISIKWRNELCYLTKITDDYYLDPGSFSLLVVLCCCDVNYVLEYST